jgi:hypothetical protein
MGEYSIKAHNQEASIVVHKVQIKECEQSVKYLGENFQEASKQYNSLVDAYSTRELSINQTLADHQLQVCWIMQHYFLTLMTNC